jgi:acetyl-CoA C-acetyltransferase
MNDVAIIGIGLHPFGRFPGKPAVQMGAEAIQLALADAGVDWKDIQFGVGGSYEVGNPDAVTRLVGLTGIPFINVLNACATAATAIQSCADSIRFGKYDMAIAVGMDKHPRGAFTDDPAKIALPQWYAENGQFVTTKFFGMKANRYIHDHGISQETLAKVAAKNFRNGSLNPNAFRRKPISEEDILDSPVLNYPLTQYMFCAPDEGAAAVIMCRADIAHKYTSKHRYTYARWKSAPAGSAPTKCTRCPHRSRKTCRRRCTRRARHSRRPGSDRRMSTSFRCRTPTPEPR